jgi:hypothetical protein
MERPRAVPDVSRAAFRLPPSTSGIAPVPAAAPRSDFAVVADRLACSRGGHVILDGVDVAALAEFALRGVNRLVLDEPSNHLDLPAIDELEGALDRYEGPVILVTNDRALLQSVRVTRVVRVEAAGPSLTRRLASHADRDDLDASRPLGA